MKSFFLIFFPIIILITFVLMVYFFISWESSISEVRFLKKKLSIDNFANKKIKSYLFFFLNFSIFIFFIFFIFFFYILKIQNLENKFYFLNNFIIYQLFIFTIIYILFHIVLLAAPNYLLRKQNDLGIILNLLFFTSINIISSNNILTIFINLEIINIIIIYSFTLMAHLNFFNKKNFEFRTIWILNTTIYQFILNFFSSIFFFFFFNLLLTYTYTTNFIFLNFFSHLDNFNINLYLSMLYLAIFIKFGIGPWIFFKIEIYQGFNLLLLILYTLIYFIIILIFFLNLFIIYNLQIKLLIMFSFLNCLVILSIIFSIFIFSYFNLFTFFSFSSLLNLILILIQLFIILIHTKI